MMIAILLMLLFVARAHGKSDVSAALRLTENKGCRAALPLWQKLIQAPQPGLDIVLNYSTCLIVENKTNQAVETLQAALLKDHPQSLELRILLARAYVMENKLARASEVLDEATTLAENKPAWLKVVSSEKTNLAAKEQSLSRAKLIAAAELIESGNLDEALRLVHMARSEAPLPESFLLEAMVRREQGRSEDARFAIEEVFAHHPDEHTRQRAIKLRSEILETLSGPGSRGWAKADVSLGSDSNAFSAGKSAGYESRYQFNTAFEIGLKYFRRRQLSSAVINYTNLATTFEEIFRDVTQTYELSYGFGNRFSWQESTWFVEVEPQFNIKYEQRVSFHTRSGTALRGVWHPNKHHVEFSGTVYWDKYASNEFAVLDWTVYTTRLLYGYRWASWYPRISWELNQDSDFYPQTSPRAIIPQGYFETGPTLQLSYSFAKPLELSAWTTLHYRKFLQTSPDGYPRREHELSGGVKGTYSITESFVPYVLWDLTHNVSTMGPTDAEDRNYNRWRVMGGFTVFLEF
jgi:tetratricopeptide (TPR) repeat protein